LHPRQRFTGSGAPRSPSIYQAHTHTRPGQTRRSSPRSPSLHCVYHHRLLPVPRTPLLTSISIYTRPGASSGETDDWLSISSRSSRGLLLLTASVPLSLSEHGSGGAGSQRRQGAAPHPRAVAGDGGPQGQRRCGGGVHAVARHARHGAVPLGGRAREAQAPAAAGRLLANGAPAAASTDRGEGDNAWPQLVPLKLPPRLQVPKDHSLSPKTVLQGPYGCTGGGSRRPPRMALSRVASLRRTPSTGGGFFSRRKTDSRDRDARAPADASCTPSPSSSSSSASSVFFFTNGSRHLPADPEEADDAKEGSVRITRFRRNRSLPSMTTSHLWVRRLCSLLLSSAFPARLALFLLSFRKAEMKAEDSALPTRSLFAALPMVSELLNGSVQI
jgi:hypothetical protein